MTTLFREKEICPVCGEENENTTIGSVLSLGQIDLDTRNVGMGDVTRIINRCHKCHYVFERYDADIEKIKDIVNSSGYQEIFTSDVYVNSCTASYAALAFIHKKLAEDNVSIGFDYLAAAWMEDDETELDEETDKSSKENNVEKAKKNAVSLRLQAIEFLKGEAEDTDIKFILIDLYRRTGQFDEAENLLSSVKDMENETIVLACDIQKILIGNKDISRYQLSKETLLILKDRYKQ